MYPCLFKFLSIFGHTWSLHSALKTCNAMVMSFTWYWFPVSVDSHRRPLVGFLIETDAQYQISSNLRSRLQKRARGRFFVPFCIILLMFFFLILFVVSMQSHSVPIVTCDYVCPLVWMTLCVRVINSALYASLSHKNIFCISKTSAKYTKPNANDPIPLYSHFMDIILHVQAQQWGFVLLSWSGQCLNRATHC